MCVIGRKEKWKKDRDRGERKKERRKREADEKAGEEKKRREEEKRRGEKKKEGRRKTRNRESSARDAPPSPGAFPSRKLGNNMTPTKGRLGKNTTPTCRDPEALEQPPRKTRTSNIHPTRTSFACYKSQNPQKYRKQEQQNHHL